MALAKSEKARLVSPNAAWQSPLREGWIPVLSNQDSAAVGAEVGVEESGLVLNRLRHRFTSAAVPDPDGLILGKSNAALTV